MLMMLALWARPLEGESQLMLMMLALGACPLEGGSQLMLMMLALGPVPSRRVAADAHDARFGARLLKEGRS